MKKLTFSIDGSEEDNERMNVLLDELLKLAMPALKRIQCHKHNGNIKIHLVEAGNNIYLPEVYSCCEKFERIIAKKVFESFKKA